MPKKDRPQNTVIGTVTLFTGPWWGLAQELTGAKPQQGSGCVPPVWERA